MKPIKIQQLDYRYLLVDNYKLLGLNEKELVILLLIDSVECENPTLITAEQLTLKMCIEESEIDTLLTSLLERKFLSYENYNSIMYTSIKNTKEKILELFKRDMLISSDSNFIKFEDEGSEVYKAFEEKLKRSLTPIEFDTIRSWFVDGIKKEAIIDALNECALKYKHITLKAVDKIIMKNMTSSDRKKEGYSVVDEKHKKDIDEAIEIASYDWIHS